MGHLILILNYIFAILELFFRYNRTSLFREFALMVCYRREREGAGAGVPRHTPTLSYVTNCFSIHQKLNFFSLAQKQQRLKFSDLTNLSLSNDIIPVSSSARNLGFIFDSDMSFSDQINSVSKSCHFHIRDIRRIRHLLPLSTATALANSLVSSKLDYCNSLYSGISQTNLNKLQRIQNSLARVITNTSKYQHITPTLKKTTLASYQTKNRLQNLSSHIQNTYKSTTYISLQ